MTEAAAPTPAKGEETPFRYTAQMAGEIELKWQGRWEEDQAFRALNPGEAGFDSARPKFYCLDMFPYPSGAGLHVGHPEGYTATDIICRLRRMQGFNVLHPMGWDAFGLPAEQYALQTGVHPAITTKKAIDTFRNQLKRFGFSYDWSRELATIDPDYYRWTQWIWLQCYGAYFDEATARARPISELEFVLARDNNEVELPQGDGRRRWRDCTPQQQQSWLDARRLAYLGEQTVNWCPQLGTVLANEEVINGRSERGGFPVSRLPLRQWMFRITAYADRLLADLQLVDWPVSTRAMQEEWIGRSEGALVQFEMHGPAGSAGDLAVYTTRPDTLFGATYMVLAPEHPLVVQMIANPAAGVDVAALRAYVEAARNRSEVDRQAESVIKTGAATGWMARNPATGALIPIWVADYVLMGYGTGAIMAVPGHDQRDFDFARAFSLPVVQVVDVAGQEWTGDAATPGEGRAINSASAELSLDGLPTAQAKARIIEWLQKKVIGQAQVQYRLRDWLFSRQRYWGEPMPVAFDEAGIHHPVDEASLPVRLPELADFKPVESATPVPPLSKARQWVETTAGAAGICVGRIPPDAVMHRETNTMPNWAGSCWYYLRYCAPACADRFVDSRAERYWMAGRGVDLYVGGSEHAVLHLLYARFWHKVLFDLGHVSTVEPFGKLFHQGLITSFAYTRQDGSLVPVDEVDEAAPGFVERATGKPVARTVAKMSKSLRNVVNPDDVIAQYGADAFRLYEMYMGPLEASKPWNPRDIPGVFRFLQRLWRLLIDERTGQPLLAREADPRLERLLHRTVAKVAHDIDRLAFNTAIAALIEMVNEATRPFDLTDAGAGGLTRDQALRLVSAAAPFAPHIAEELWGRLGGTGLVAHASWPAVDAAMLVDEKVEIAVQVLGKVKLRLQVSAADAADVARLEAAALAHPEVIALLAGRVPKKAIAVPGRLINLVV